MHYDAKRANYFMRCRCCVHDSSSIMCFLGTAWELLLLRSALQQKETLRDILRTFWEHSKNITRTSWEHSENVTSVSNLSLKKPRASVWAGVTCTDTSHLVVINQIKSNHFYCHIITAHVPWWVKFLRACSRQCRNN